VHSKITHSKIIHLRATEPRHVLHAHGRRPWSTSRSKFVDRYGNAGLEDYVKVRPSSRGIASLAAVGEEGGEAGSVLTLEKALSSQGLVILSQSYFLQDIGPKPQFLVNGEKPGPQITSHHLHTV
jgi:hypothetical protein